MPIPSPAEQLVVKEVECLLLKEALVEMTVAFGRLDFAACDRSVDNVKKLVREFPVRTVLHAVAGPHTAALGMDMNDLAQRGFGSAAGSLDQAARKALRRLRP